MATDLKQTQFAYATQIYPVYAPITNSASTSNEHRCRKQNHSLVRRELVMRLPDSARWNHPPCGASALGFGGPLSPAAATPSQSFIVPDRERFICTYIELAPQHNNHNSIRCKSTWIPWIMFHGHLNYLQKPPLGGRYITKLGDHFIPNAHNC